MSNGREFQRTEAATGNERRPTVDRRKDGTRSDCEDDDLMIVLAVCFFVWSRVTA